MGSLRFAGIVAKSTLLLACVWLSGCCTNSLKYVGPLFAKADKGLSLEVTISDSLFSLDDIYAYDTIKSTWYWGMDEYLSRSSILRGPKIRLTFRNATNGELFIPFFTADKIGGCSQETYVPDLLLRLLRDSKDMSDCPKTLFVEGPWSPCDDLEMRSIPPNGSLTYPVMIDVFLAMEADHRQQVTPGTYEIKLCLSNYCWKDTKGISDIWLGRAESNVARFTVVED